MMIMTYLQVIFRIMSKYMKVKFGKPVIVHWRQGPGRFIIVGKLANSAAGQEMRDLGNE